MAGNVGFGSSGRWGKEGISGNLGSSGFGSSGISCFGNVGSSGFGNSGNGGISTFGKEGSPGISGFGSSGTSRRWRASECIMWLLMISNIAIAIGDSEKGKRRKAIV